MITFSYTSVSAPINKVALLGLLLLLANFLTVVQAEAQAQSTEQQSQSQTTTLVRKFTENVNGSLVNYEIYLPRKERDSDKILVGEVVKIIQPKFSAKAKKAHPTEVIAVAMQIDEKGIVSGATLASGAPIFADAATKAVSKWRFAPTRVNGRPISVTGTVFFDVSSQ